MHQWPHGSIQIGLITSNILVYSRTPSDSRFKALATIRCPQQQRDTGQQQRRVSYFLCALQGDLTGWEFFPLRFATYFKAFVLSV